MAVSPERSDRVVRASAFGVLSLFLLLFGVLMLVGTRDELWEWGYKLPNWATVLILLVGGVAALVRAVRLLRRR
ncbi:hypothetical protein [Motilibacter deserti]|uniref:DUF3955 domain-containing protein n=1 Tax=Motilibacter deserti TaxID=2714956 RepID=A0ABX0H096_9ACTN|nr:hypothetical protein [Motilibacter deserti]NHC16285.1 hypothetical protein [Motilibacter deserti]